MLIVPRQSLLIGTCSHFCIITICLSPQISPSEMKYNIKHMPVIQCMGHSIIAPD